MRKKKNKKLSWLALLLFITIGYALLSTTLKINGIAGIKSNRWDIHWDDESITEADYVVTANPAAYVKDQKKTIVEFGVSLNLPGDYYEFYVDAVNEGTIDGVISSVEKNVYDAANYDASSENNETITLPDYIIYTVTYADDDTTPKRGDVLKKDDLRTYKVRVEYDNESSQLAPSDVSYIFNYEVTYEQSKESSNDNNTPEDTSVLGSLPQDDCKVTVEHSNGDKEIRYMCNDPKNYVYFNCTDPDNQTSDTCELWRIIGEDSNGKMKIIKNDFLPTEMQWNSTAYSDWGTSTLKNYLNGTYYDGLKDSAKELISESAWNTSSWLSDEESKNGIGAFPEWAYLKERSNNSVNSTSTTVTANVGLMNASDYGFSSKACYSVCPATSYSCAKNENDNWIIYNEFVDSTTENIIGTNEITGKPIFDEMDYSKNICKESSWLVKDSSEWTITPAFVENQTRYVWTTSTNGGIDWWMEANYSTKVRPAVYLKKETKIKSGEGTSTNPYQLKISATTTPEEPTTPEADPTCPYILSQSQTSACQDKNPTCTLGYVNVLSNGFSYSFSCKTGDKTIKMSQVRSIFDYRPDEGQYDGTTFERTGTLKRGRAVNGGSTMSYSSRWTTANSPSNPPNNRTCYYFVFTGKDANGCWTAYRTNECYRFPR